MFRRLQNILCCVVIAGFAAVCWYGKNNGEAVMTGGAVKTTMDKPVVVIDPGHGGVDGGCVSVDGTPEKGINLAVAESLRDGLRLLGYDVVCTRESDISIYDKGTEGLGEQKKSDMKNRLAIFSKYSEGISVSIHQKQFIDNVIEVFRIVRIHTTDIIRSNTIHPIAVVVFGLFVVFLHIGDHFIHFFRSRSFFHDFIQFGINQRFQMLCLVRITIEAHRHAIVGVRLAYRTGLNTYTVSSSFFFPDIFGIS